MGFLFITTPQRTPEISDKLKKAGEGNFLIEPFGFFALLQCSLMKYVVVPVENEMDLSFPLERFQTVHTRPAPLCLLKNCNVPFARFFHRKGKGS